MQGEKMFINDALAQTAAAATPQVSMTSTFCSAGADFRHFLTLLIRPQQKKIKQHQMMLEAIKKATTSLPAAAFTVPLPKPTPENWKSNRRRTDRYRQPHDGARRDRSAGTAGCAGSSPKPRNHPKKKNKRGTFMYKLSRSRIYLIPRHLFSRNIFCGAEPCRRQNKAAQMVAAGQSRA